MNQSKTTANAVPFLRWAGGKRWLAPGIASALEPFIAGRYIEPFLGGGSMFFWTNPTTARLSDINEELINAYRQVRDFPCEIERELSKIEVSRETYLLYRRLVPQNDLARAIRFIYLNRTCFNGIYRTNKKGEFNVPFGGESRSPQVILGNRTLFNVSEALLNAELFCCDFEVSVDLAADGDVLYADPAYTVAHDNNGFIRYNDKVFLWSDQIRLRDSALRAMNRGAIVLISNAAHSSIASLYHPHKGMRLRRMSRVAARKGRQPVEEFLFLLCKRPEVRRTILSALMEANLLSTKNS